MTHETNPTFDSLLQDLGDFGPYQLITIALLCIPASFLNAWTIYDQVFLLYSPEKSCHAWNINSSFVVATFKNTTTRDDCEYEGVEIWTGHENVRLHCENWTIDQRYFDNTPMTQWGLCQDPTLSKSVLSIFLITSVFGMGVMSLFQDWIGRKWTFFICLTLNLAGCGFSTLASSFVAWIAIRSIQATQGANTYSLLFIWAQEFVGPQKRTFVNFLITLFFSVATVTLGVVAWACRNWIKLELAITFPFLFLYSYYFLVDESPRWLLSVGKVQEAKAIVKKIALKNKKQNRLDEFLNRVDHIAKTCSRNPKTEDARFQPLELFRFPNLRLKIILITLIWISNCLVYNAVAYNAPNLGNFFVAYIAQASVEAPACVFNLFLSNRIGRIPPMILSMLWSCFFAFMCIPAFIGGWNEWYAVIFAALCKFGICISYNILYQAAGELYPTSLRGTGVGVNIIAGNLFQGIMPYILATASTAKWTPMLILGIITFIGAVLCCFLPEPMDQAMPQTALEAEKMSKVGVQQIKVHVKNVVMCD